MTVLQLWEFLGKLPENARSSNVVIELNHGDDQAGSAPILNAVHFQGGDLVLYLTEEVEP